MGLSIEVGVLADLLKLDSAAAEDFEKDLAQVNSALAENGLPSHYEPTNLPTLENRAVCSSFPYSYLHFLRRVYAHVINKPTWLAEPVPHGEDPAEDQLVLDESLEFSSHLLVHSDSAGFYIPIEFESPLFADDKMCGGGIIGSSQGLIKELVLIAPSLGIRLNSLGELSDEEAQKIRNYIDEEGPLFIELLVWLSLFEAARLSIEVKTVIVFT